MILDDALESLSEDRKATFLAALERFGAGSRQRKRMVRELFTEPRGESDWSSLFEEVVERPGEARRTASRFEDFWLDAPVSFERVLGAFCEDLRAGISGTLKLLDRSDSIAQQMLRNLYVERGLLRRDWRRLIEALVGLYESRDLASGASAEDLAAIQEVFREFCRENRILKGIDAAVPPSRCLGRVVNLDDLCDLMVKLGYHAEKEEAREEVQCLLDRPTNDLPSYWKRRDLGRFLMWATFDPDGDSPLGNPLPAPERVVCQLGLPASPGKGPPVVFQYCLPSGAAARKPTFCDAYAADFWPRYFRPNPLPEPYGRTMPTDTCPEEVGRPEVVHEVVTGESLKAPPRYLSNRSTDPSYAPS